jgi:hypothetical protein
MYQPDRLCGATIVETSHATIALLDLAGPVTLILMIQRAFAAQLAVFNASLTSE